jgi:dTDP-4-amino-4,6-dideoxygalactose transaminase
VIEVPRLPIVGRGTFGKRVSASVPSVVDERCYLLTTSGRAAILLALRALGVGPGDRVLVPTYHCPTMIAPVVHLGAEPRYYPIDDDGLPRLDDLALAAGDRTKALLAAHWFGLPLRLDAVAGWCWERGIAMIEDCAHAFFGFAGDRPVGRTGDLATASLPKFFPVPEGGCLIGREELIKRIELARASIGVQLRSVADVVELAARFGRLGYASGPLRALFALKTRLRRGRPVAEHAPSTPDADDDVSEYLNEATCMRRPAWIAATIFRHTERMRTIAARRANYRRLAQWLADVRGARPLRPRLEEGAVPYVFPLDVDRPEAAYQAIRSAGVPVFRWDRLWPGTPALPGDATSRWSRHVLQLGCHQDIGEQQLASIARIVREQVERAA